MGVLNLNSSSIRRFSVQVTSEIANGYAFDVIDLNVGTDAFEIRYRIVSDTRHPNISQIKQDLESGLTQARDSSACFDVNEYLERDYIFVTFPNGKQEQYTARRIQTK